MSKKNKNIKTYDINSVFDEYMVFLAEQNAIKSNDLSLEIENLKEEIKTDKEVFLNLQAKIVEIESLEKEIKKIAVLPREKRVKLEEDLKEAEEKHLSLNFKYEQIINLDPSLFTEEQHKKWNEKIAKAETSMNRAYAKVKTLRARIENDDKNIEAYNNQHHKVDALLNEISKTDDTFETFSFDPLEEAKSSLRQLNTDIIEKESSLRTLKAEHAKVSGDPIPDLESFTAFLEENGLSTIHAEDLFKHHNNPNAFEKIAYEDFRMRKMHPKRDYVIKKVVVPAAITCTGIGATIGAIAGSGLVGGSVVMGVIPVSGTPGLTAMASGITGAAVGLASTPVVIKGKNLITRTYYKLRAKSAVKNLEDYEDGTDIENLSISKLVNKIQNTQHKILESRGPKHLILKTINRNRIHQVEAYTKQLFAAYREIEADETLSKPIKEEALQPMFELLANIEEFIANDIAESKTHAMLTCKEKKKHHHKYLIENVDIYANLKIYIDRLAKINAEQDNKKAMMKNAKKTTKNLAQKKKEAYNIVYNSHIITNKLKPITISPLSNFDVPQLEEPKNIQPLPESKKSPANFTPAPEVEVVSWTTTDKDITLNLENGKKITLPLDEVKNDIIVTAKEGKNKYSITYADGTKQEIMKKAKVLPEIETARHVLGALLHDEEFIKGLKAEGYQSQTINALKQRLTDWISNPTQKLVLSGKVKELYSYSMDGINTQAKEEMNINL